MRLLRGRGQLRNALSLARYALHNVCRTRDLDLPETAPNDASGLVLANLNRRSHVQVSSEKVDKVLVVDLDVAELGGCDTSSQLSSCSDEPLSYSPKVVPPFVSRVTSFIFSKMDATARGVIPTRSSPILSSASDVLSVPIV